MFIGGMVTIPRKKNGGFVSPGSRPARHSSESQAHGIWQRRQALYHPAAMGHPKEN